MLMSNKCSYFFPAFTRSRSLELVYSKCIVSVFYPDDIFRFVPQKRIFFGFFSNRSFYLLFRYVYFFWVIRLFYCFKSAAMRRSGDKSISSLKRTFYHKNVEAEKKTRIFTICVHVQCEVLIKSLKTTKIHIPCIIYSNLKIVFCFLSAIHSIQCMRLRCKIYTSHFNILTLCCSAVMFSQNYSLS